MITYLMIIGMGWFGVVTDQFNFTTEPINNTQVDFYVEPDPEEDCGYWIEIHGMWFWVFDDCDP